MQLEPRQTCLQKILSAVAFRVPHSCAAAIAGTFCAAVAAIAAVKIFKLPASTSEGVFGTHYAQLAALSAARKLLDSELPRLIVASIVISALATQLRPKWRASSVWLVVLSIVYGMSVLTAVIAQEPHPAIPYFISNAWAQAREFTSLFWRDILSATVVTALISLATLHGDRKWARVVAVVGVASILVLLSADAAYFVVARAELSSSELRYIFASPIDALTAARDGLSRELVLPVLFPWLSIPLGVGIWLLSRYLYRRLSIIAGRSHVALGPWMYGILALALAAPATPEDPRAERFTGNVLTRQLNEFAIRPLLRLASQPRGSGEASILHPAPTALIAGESSNRFNVVLVLLESTRADAVSAYNPSHNATPNLDDLAKAGLQVDDMYAVVPRTSSAWIASVAGIYPSSIAALRKWSSRYPQAGISSSLAKLLGQNGYATAFFMPTRLDFENDTRIVDALGFQTVFSADQLDSHTSERLNSFGFADAALLPHIGSWLDARKASRQPFFLTVMTNSGHYPYGQPTQWMGPFHENVGVLPAQYLNAIAYTDHYVGQLLDQLRQRSQFDNSLIIVLGDHGEGFLEHGLVWHAGLPYVEGLHIPALIKLPGRSGATGHVVGPRQQIDIAPTVAEVLGLTPAGGRWPGISLLEPVPDSRTLYFGTHFDDLNLGLLRNHRKYVYHFDRRSTEVYDLSTDPKEMHPVTSQTSRRAILRAESEMRDWYEAVRSNYANNSL